MEKRMFLVLLTLLSSSTLLTLEGIHGVSQPLSLNLSTNILSLVIGNRTSFTLTVKSGRVQTTESVRVLIEGGFEEWFRVVPESVNIPGGKTESFLVVVNVSAGTEPGVYELRIKASDGVESNPEALTLIVGESFEEVINLLSDEFKKAKTTAEESLRVKDCIETTLMRTVHLEAEKAYKKGFEEYRSGEDFERVVNWLEYAILTEKEVVEKVDKSLEKEIEALKKTKALILPLFKPDEHFSRVETYLREKDYGKVCVPIEKIRKLTLFSLIFWPASITIVLLLMIMIAILRKRARERERLKLLERVKERLGQEPTRTLQ